MNRPTVNLPLPNPVATASYNEANQMLSFNDKNISYDNNGNMTSVINTCGTTNYSWDARNRLIAINGFNTDCSPLSASFKYDALNRRIEKAINGVTAKYLYDGLDIIQELNQDGSVKADYIRGLNIDEPFARIKADGTIRIFHQDVLGSVIALTDDTGIVKTTYNYDPFGNTTVSGEPSDNSFQFAGRENDETGLLHERNRYYSYELMRYISQDPIGLAGGDVNFYVRVGNSPINYIDPLGLEETSWVGYGRNPLTIGPRNGNWGGKNFSGGQNPLKNDGNSGIKGPLDSGDYCYYLHDRCYEIGQKSVEQCNKELIKNLNELDNNPQQWPVPPRKGTERDSSRFRKWALWWFSR